MKKWILVLLTVSPLLAQGPTGEITGIVMDPSSAIVAGAAVDLLNTATGAARRVATNLSGAYAFPSLPPGIYTMTVEAPGFRKQTRPGIELQVQQTARIDFTLAVGDTSETMEVLGEAPQMVTEDSTVGQVIENKRILELPLNGRNYLQLAALAPGVNINSSASGAAGFQGGNRSRQAVSINGQRSQFSHFTLDGLENTDPNINSYIFLPSIEALQEFKVQSATYPAEYGYALGQINATTRSGTNRIHGSVFEFLRNSALDAKNYFDRPNEKIPPFRRNQFGATIGGPVVKNKLFYFGNYEGLRELKALTRTSTVPVAEWRNGNLSQRRPVYDPTTRVQQSDGRITAQQFPGNIIPQERIEPRAKAVLEFLPLPNLAGTPNYLNNESLETRADQYTIRVDYQHSANSIWYGRTSYTKEKEYQPAAFPRQGQQVNTRADQFLIANTWILSPSLVNDARFGWNRLNNQVVGPNSESTNVVQQLGIPGLDTSNPLFWGIPNFGLTGFTNFGEGTSAFVTTNNLYETQENLTWTRGRHSFKFGLNFKPILFNNLGNQFPRGSFLFDGTATQNPLNITATGEPIADLLLGYTKEASTAVRPADAELRSTYWAGYFSHSFRITHKLTLNYGLRYEYLPPFRDNIDSSVNVFGLDTPNPILVRASNLGAGLDPYEGQKVRFTRAELVRDGRLGPGLVDPDRNNVAPRLGIAYSIRPQTVFRAGFGTYYNMIDLGNATYDMARTLAGLRRESTNANFPDLTLGQPFRTDASAARVLLPQPLILGNSIDTRTSYVNQWTLDVQHSLKNDLMLEVSYVGSQSHRLKRITSKNLPVPGPGSIDANRPFQQFGYVQYPDTIGNANYNALQIRLEQRLRNGFTCLSSYSWGKSIDDTSGVRPGAGDTLFTNRPDDNNRGERGRSAFDARHRWVTSMLYELPVRFQNKWTNGLIGGWQLGGILTLESGLPATPAAGFDAPNVGVGSNPRPNATGSSPRLSESERSPRRYFNTAAFALQSPFTYGNAGRNVIDGPGIVNLDFSVLKRIPFAESRYLELRGEAFNLANHPIFGPPNATLNSPAYGRLTSTRIDSRQLQIALKIVF